jgi:myo-inositol-1-phosphate synthase
MDPDNIHVGPSDYVPFLLDRKYCHIRMEGRTFGDVPLLVEAKLEVWDSPNSAGVVIDALRCIKLALDNGISGALTAPSSYFMKTPMVQYSDEEAHKKTEEFIKTYALTEKKETKAAAKPSAGKKAK